MKKKCVVRVIGPTTMDVLNAWESPEESARKTTYYSIYDPEKEVEIAWGKQIAITPCVDKYTTGGSDIKGYRCVSPTEMQQIIDANIMVDVEYHSVKCDSPCGMCDEFGCLGNDYPITLMNKVIIEWKTS